MLLKFDEYNKFNDFIKSHTVEDDNFLNERLSISEDVISETMRVVKYIESEISNGNFKIVSDKNVVEGLDHYVIKLKHYEIKLFDRKCKLNLSIHRFIGNDETDVLDTLETDAKILHSTKHGIFALFKAKVNYELSGDIVLYNDRISEGSYAVLAHEIRHAYEYKIIYDNKPLFTVLQKIECDKKWKNIYMKSCSFISNPNNTPNSKSEGEFFNLITSIYMSDVSEISAFTQQTYEQCKKCKTIDDLKKSMKESKLQTMLDVYKMTLDFLKNPEIQANFNEKISEYGLTEIPSFKKLEMLFQKRYKRAKSNYGKVFTFIKEEIDSDEDGEVIFTDVKY